MSSSPLSISAYSEYASVNYTENKDIYGLVSIATRGEINVIKRASIDLVCVIDVSGSMAGEKLKLVKESLVFITNQLKDNDRLAVVTFGSRVDLTYDLNSMNESNKKVLKTEVIPKINTHGCTNLSGGLFKGLSLLLERDTPNPVSTVILFTDGDANEGETDADKLVSTINSYKRNPSMENVSIFSFGVGTDHKASFLQSISSTGTGVYYYIENQDKITTAFKGCIDGLMSVVAQDINVTIKSMSPDKDTVKYVSISAPKIKVQSTPSKFMFGVGDLFLEETRDIPFVLSLSNRDKEEFDNTFEVQVQYVDILSSQLCTETVILKIYRSSTTTYSDDKSRSNIDVNRNRVDTVTALRSADEFARKGDIEEAREVLRLAHEKVCRSFSTDDSIVENMKRDLLNTMLTLKDKHTYVSTGEKDVVSKFTQYETQRSTALSDENRTVTTWKGSNRSVKK